MENIDPLLDWLGTEAYIVNDDGGDFVKIKCPWANEHTTGDDTAGYSPLGRGEDDWVLHRGFKCLHEHCKGKGFRQFMDVLKDTDAPQVSGVDPLPWLQHRYPLVGMPRLIADLIQRGRGGDKWLWDIGAWGDMNKGRILVPGRDAPVEMKTAYLEHPRTSKVDDLYYWPVKADEDTAILEKNGQYFINKYVPPIWPLTTEDPEIFLEHIYYILPDRAQADLFLDWLAFKVQNPIERGFAIIMIAEDSFGIGRSWLGKMLRLMFQAKVKTATMAQLIGKGTSAEQNYNDWMTECQLLVVEEAKADITKEEFYTGFETFKQNVDTSVGQIRVNPKYGKTRNDLMFFNTLIFSNHTDALVIPENDRRVCVMTNATKMREPEYYERLHASVTPAEAAKLYWYLMEQDLEGYNNVYPPHTVGKRLMIEQNILPSAAIRDRILDTCTGDIFTRKMLKSLVLHAANTLDYDNIAASTGTVVKAIWGKMGKLRDERNGARYTIGGEPTEVRALRNVDEWKAKDADRDSAAFAAEILKNDITGGAGLTLVI